MNKTGKSYINNLSSDLSALPVSPNPLELDATTDINISEPNWETTSNWEPFIRDMHSEDEDSRWVSMIYDLLHNFDEMEMMLRHTLEHKSWLNAFLLAAGLKQIVEDYLRSDPFLFKKAAKYLDRLPRPAGSFLANCARAAVKIWFVLNKMDPSIRMTTAWQRKISNFVNLLADIVVDPEHTDLGSLDKLVADGEAILSDTQNLPASLRKEVIKLPSCFRSFDQQPADLKRIVEEFSIHWPDQRRPICVVGVRTSGSYLAPLYAAILKSMGYHKVSLLTLRPGDPLTSDEAVALQGLARGNGLALLCDDPPISGSSLITIASTLEHKGIRPGNIIQMLQLFGDAASLPVSLQKYPSVIMSWDYWSIHRHLEPDAVKELLSELCAPSFQVFDVVRIPDEDIGESRQHVIARYRVKILNLSTNQFFYRLVLVKGVGLGYFGEHTLAVAKKLPEYTADVITLQDGLIYREFVIPVQKLTSSILAEEEKWNDSLVSYIMERSRKLPAQGDTSLQVNSRNAVWEVASNLLSKTFGRMWLLFRIPLIDPFVKELLEAASPTIIDGDMSLQNWLIQEKLEEPLAKLNIAEKDFSHKDLYCYDPVYDLASLAVDIDSNQLSAQLRRTYEFLSGQRVSSERWMLYQLVCLWDLIRQNPETSQTFARRMAQVVQGYFNEIYFQNLEINPHGPVCAFDLDGVLETNQLNFPSLSPSSARSLRALAKHGFQVVLATGRSLGELKERCAAYHLAGGTAEYGAVIYDHKSNEEASLLTENELGTLYGLRARIANMPDIYLDQDYRFVVRAYCLDERGHRKGLSPELTSQILNKSCTSARVYAIPGEAQTDFMVKRINKGVGLKQWLKQFGPGSENPCSIASQITPIALAVGDSFPDLPMVALAHLAFAPANASLEVQKAGIRVTNRPYQRGFEQAVSKLLGHKPGNCPICQLEALSQETAYMLDILAVQENGRAYMPLQALKLFMRKEGWLNGSSK